MIDEGERLEERARSFLVLGTLPEACVIPVDEVREVVGSDSAPGSDGRPVKTWNLETLGLSGRPGAPERLLVLVRAPHGPYLQFAAEVAQKELRIGDLLPLPARPFSASLFSALVVQDQRVVGLMLDVGRLLGAREDRSCNRL